LAWTATMLNYSRGRERAAPRAGTTMEKGAGGAGPTKRRKRIPRSFKELTPSNHFNPRTFFYEMIWKGWFTPRGGVPQAPNYPQIVEGQVAITWIGHASSVPVYGLEPAD
jgi:hypothetical protein